MKIILTESQTSRLITLLENKSFEDYINDLDEIIDSRETHRKGMNNYSFTKGVAAIQAGLDKLGYGFSTFGIDGKYGNETEKNVKKFQEDEGLEVTGKMSTKDIEKLKSILGQKVETKKEDKQKTKKETTKKVNGGTYIIEMNDPNSDDLTIIWGGYPSSTYGAKWMKNNGGDKYFSDKNVLYSNFENSLDALKNVLSSNGINDYNIKSVSGFSAGGTQAWKHINDSFDFVGLIDPTTKKEYNSLPSNVEVISNSGNWTGLPRIATFLKKLENKKFKNVKKINIGHLKMPEKFYEMYSDRM
jgi:peptidoglycan hydrolase-like protein with peptidoglycan-binding domain